MTEHIHQRSTFDYIVKFFGIFLAILCFTLIGQAVAVALLLPLHGYDVMEVFNSLTSYNNRFELLLTQGISALFTFIIGPLVYGFYFDKSYTLQLRRPTSAPSQYWISIFIVITLLPLGGLILYWNQNVQLPEFLSGVETWFRTKEIHLAEVTAFLVNFENFWEFLLGFIVIAVFAGVGEEIVFRGFLQRYLEGIFKNVHVGIWLSAFIFSAIHVQFYGFFVRMLLGVLFGYLFLWSGRSLYPCIIAHITNNAITVISVYLNKEEYLPEMKDPFSTEAPEWYVVLISTVIALGLLYYYRKLGNKKIKI
ncbi:CPBP family intramembrane glutamic endopeptidase [Flammeovirga pacifica]|uniref:CAAX prenyl protease 2/Lysostaphin resistance protein A-like domain-containing protein n=1 Tax=Flammeovirga pacifica TaxID=915059 RepID=A0A1S1Z0T6_FLAPC|nr:CPBP family intramembrane glutamic endopeptidase [Flammeovirga pacifica]OHX66876.1 hypothetical protein NH26_11160 [Flammeovirga pacifica]